MKSDSVAVFLRGPTPTRALWGNATHGDDLFFLIRPYDMRDMGASVSFSLTSGGNVEQQASFLDVARQVALGAESEHDQRDNSQCQQQQVATYIEHRQPSHRDQQNCQQVIAIK